MENDMTMVRECCAPNYAQEAQAWATTNFGGAAMGDKRRTRRLVAMAAAMTENPSMSLPKQLPDWSDLTGAYRLLSNDQVNPQAILAPHVALVRRAAADHPVVLCVQDDTQLDFTCRTGIRGLGITGDGAGRGLLQHTALAVLPDKQVLGVLDIAWHAVAPAPKGETRRQRQARWNVRDVWQDAAEHIGPWSSGSKLVHVGDRHADLFRFMHKATALGHDFVVRAVHDRYVDEETERLWHKMARQVVLGYMDVTVGLQRDKGNRVKRMGREARLTIRVASISVPPAINDPRTQNIPPLALWAIHVIEEHPPEGQEALEWMLLTSLEATTLQQAQIIIGYYTCRWVIEEWHRCLKEGCRIEASQLDEAEDLQRLGAVQSVLAVRLLQMRDLAEGSTPAADSIEALRMLVPSLYVLIVAGLAKVKPETLTPHQFWRTVAKRGGYLGRKHDPRPGWKVLWRGWSDIVQMVRGAEMYQLACADRKCV
jgi:transposase-like protein/transposase Tn5 family protein